MNQIILNNICWGTFCLVWIIGAIYNHFKAKTFRKKLNLRIIVLIGILSIALIGQVIPEYYWNYLNYRAEWLTIVGELLLIISTIFTLWSRVILGIMWSGNAVIKEGHQLRINGPYRVTRHPIYTGILSMILGSILMNGFGLVIFLYFIIIVVLLKYKIRSEEKILTEEFGEEYQNYKSNTPQLLPTFKSFKK
jgi:protein-S-isoprenylcysteine O-methyltransferase Ste14